MITGDLANTLLAVREGQIEMRCMADAAVYGSHGMSGDVYYGARFPSSERSDVSLESDGAACCSWCLPGRVELCTACSKYLVRPDVTTE